LQGWRADAVPAGMRLWSWACCGLGVWVSGCGSDGSDATGGAHGGAAGSRVSDSGDSGGSGGSSGSSGSSGATPGGAGTSSVPDMTPPSLGTCRVFPADNAWNQDVSALPVHADSDTFIDSIGRDDHVHPDFGTEWEGAPIGIPFISVGAGEPSVPIQFVAYGDESDPGPYPLPLDAPIEGGADSDGDRHVIAIDTSACKLYELYRAFPAGNAWDADSGAVFDLRTNDEHPYTFTSADAAGLPIFPGLVRYDEVVTQGELRHAVRFTVSRSRRALIAPARHHAGASDDPSLPPMGLRLRMKASYDCSSYSAEARVICAGLKRYGLLLADNGSDFYLSGAPDPRWDDDALGDLKQVTGDAFEAVETGPIVTY
jgi:hypothetical protein